MTLTKDQRNHLLQRISVAHRVHQYPDPTPLPAKVAAAKAVVEAYDKAKNDARQARTKKLDDAVMAAREAVEFAASPEIALKAVKVLEAFKG